VTDKLDIKLGRFIKAEIVTQHLLSSKCLLTQ